MFSLFNFQSTGLDALFTYCAYLGSFLYGVRLLLSFGSSIESESLDPVFDHSSDNAFQFLSINTLLGFCMMFGWAGLAASRQFLLSNLSALFIALATGSLFVASTKYIFKSARKLVSRGSRVDIEKIIGKRGKVYQEIGENKRGVIQVVVDDFTREFDAISVDNRAIASFQTVEILKVLDQKNVVVKHLK
jgi:membrane protein implicated in regulation of membrane protease activity